MARNGKSRGSSPLFRACLEALEDRQLLSTTIYVAPSGSNSSGDGSIGRPYATLEYAASFLAAGTTLIAEAGTYAGFALGLGHDNPVTGTAANPVVIEADPNAAPGSVVINSVWTSNSQTGIDAIRLHGAANQYITIKGFTVNNNGSITESGIHITGYNTGYDTVEYNTITGMGSWGIFTSFCNGSLFLGNICNNTQVEHGMYISNTCYNDSIVGNTCANNNGSGIHMNGDMSQGTGVAGVTANNYIYGNVIYNNCAAGGGAIDCDGIQNSIIEDNLFYNNHHTAMSLYTGNAAGGSINNIVANNTIVMPSGASWAININSAADYLPGPVGSTGNIFFNNVVFGASSSNGDFQFDTLSLPGTQSDHNVIAGWFSTDYGNSHMNLAQWQTATGQDAHTVTSNAAAVFVNPGSLNYQLKAGSPAIGRGVAAFAGNNAPTVDILGVMRPEATSWDAGAYEYFPTTYTGASGSDNYTLQLDPTGTNINVLVGGTLNYSAPKTLPSSLTFNLAAAAGSLTVNTLNGNPIPAGGITVTGGASADSLTVFAPTGNNAVTVSGSQVTVNSSVINYSSLSSIAINTGSGNDTLTQNAQPGSSAALTFANGTGNDSLIVTGGTFAIPSNPTGNLSVTVGGSGAASVTFAGNASGVHGIDSYSLASLTVNTNGTATLSAAASGLTADRTLLTTNSLSVTGSVNLMGNSIDVHYGSGSDPFSTIRGNVIGGQIASSLNDSFHAVGYADGKDGVVKNLSSGDILLRFTTMGDANLDGTTNFADLVKVAQNFNATNTTWDTGDFLGTGTTGFTDLVKVAQNYNTSLNSSQVFAKPSASRLS